MSDTPFFFKLQETGLCIACGGRAKLTLAHEARPTHVPFCVPCLNGIIQARFETEDPYEGRLSRAPAPAVSLQPVLDKLRAAGEVVQQAILSRREDAFYAARHRVRDALAAFDDLVTIQQHGPIQPLTMARPLPPGAVSLHLSEVAAPIRFAEGAHLQIQVRPGERGSQVVLLRDTIKIEADHDLWPGRTITWTIDTAPP